MACQNARCQLLLQKRQLLWLTKKQLKYIYSLRTALLMVKSTVLLVFALCGFFLISPGLSTVRAVKIKKVTTCIAFKNLQVIL